MEDSDKKQVLLMAFGLPTLTTVIVLGSMYAGHVITTRSDRPTNVLVSPTPPKIDVNVPQQAAPNIEVSATAPQVDVHVPMGPAPSVTVNTPQQPAPTVTVNPTAPMVTIVEHNVEREPRPAASLADLPPAPQAAAVAATTNAPSVNSATTTVAAAPKAAAPATEPAKPASVPPAPKPAAPEAPKAPAAKPDDAKAMAPSSDGSASSATAPAEPAAIMVSNTPKAAVNLAGKDLSLDTLYRHAENYIEAYCRKNGVDPKEEDRKWNNAWRRSVDQAISDNIDSGEQSYINRIVIAKRDYFNIDKASSEKVVEACRIMLRYRDGQLAWLEAMRGALTEDNLKKTVSFLSAGPK
ncbi:MAG TPA: hypothetical protein VGP72_04945 [Planctomycetota bacterium]|jgi:hypothetical protein